nr:hypothetical protein Iba_chr13dCG11200 [Ipomoea batatas]
MYQSSNKSKAIMQQDVGTCRCVHRMCWTAEAYIDSSEPAFTDIAKDEQVLADSTVFSPSCSNVSPVNAPSLSTDHWVVGSDFLVCESVMEAEAVAATRGALGLGRDSGLEEHFFNLKGSSQSSRLTLVSALSSNPEKSCCFVSDIGACIFKTGTRDKALELEEFWLSTSWMHAPFLFSNGDNLRSPGVGLGMDDMDCVTEVGDNSNTDGSSADCSWFRL